MYQSVKIPSAVHSRARFLAAVLEKTISQIYGEAIEALWRQSKEQREAATRKFAAKQRG